MKELSLELLEKVEMQQQRNSIKFELFCHSPFVEVTERYVPEKDFFEPNFLQFRKTLVSEQTDTQQLKTNQLFTSSIKFLNSLKSFNSYWKFLEIVFFSIFGKKNEGNQFVLVPSENRFFLRKIGSVFQMTLNFVKRPCFLLLLNMNALTSK